MSDTPATSGTRFVVLHRVPKWLRPALRGIPPLDGLNHMTTSPDAVTTAPFSVPDDNAGARRPTLEERTVVAVDVVLPQEGSEGTNDMVGFKHLCLMNTKAVLRDVALGPDDVLAVASYLSLDGVEVPSHDVHLPECLSHCH